MAAAPPAPARDELLRAAHARGYAQALADLEPRFVSIERDRGQAGAAISALRHEVALLSAKIETEARAYAAAAAAPAAPVQVSVTSEALRALVQEEVAAWAKANPPAPVSVVVNVPESPQVVVPAPIVNVPKPDPVHVDVHVDVPTQPPPVVTVERPKPTTRNLRVTGRDKDGRISTATSTEE